MFTSIGNVFSEEDKGLFWYILINPKREATALSRFNYVNIIAADVLAPCVARTPVAMRLTM